jgi:hypothetical protein
VMTEFTPWTFEGRAEPAQFLRDVGEHYYITNLNPKNMAGSFQETEAGFHLVPPESFDSFTQSVAASAFGWTDLLCIPRGLPRSGELLDAVINHDRHR